MKVDEEDRSQADWSSNDLGTRVKALETRVKALEALVGGHERRLSLLEGSLPGPDAAGPDGNSQRRSALPPPFVRDLADRLAAHVEPESDVVVGLSAVVTKRDGRVTGAGTRLTRFDPVNEDIAGAEVAAFASPFASPQRVAIMNVLARRGDLAAHDLAEATGLAGGQFYHHLKELVRAGLVGSDTRGCYRLTERGSSALYAMAVLCRER